MMQAPAAPAERSRPFAEWLPRGGLAHGNKTPFITGNSGTSIAHLPPPFVNGGGTLLGNLGGFDKMGRPSPVKKAMPGSAAVRQFFFMILPRPSALLPALSGWRHRFVGELLLVQAAAAAVHGGQRLGCSMARGQLVGQLLAGRRPCRGSRPRLSVTSPAVPVCSWIRWRGLPKISPSVTKVGMGVIRRRTPRSCTAPSGDLTSGHPAACGRKRSGG